MLPAFGALCQYGLSLVSQMARTVLTVCIAIPDFLGHSGPTEAIMSISYDAYLGIWPTEIRAFQQLRLDGDPPHTSTSLLREYCLFCSTSYDSLCSFDH